MSISWIDLGIIGAYLLLMLGIGYYVFRRSPSFEEYLIAGRSMTTTLASLRTLLYLSRVKSAATRRPDPHSARPDSPTVRGSAI